MNIFLVNKGLENYQALTDMGLLDNHYYFWNESGDGAIGPYKSFLGAYTAYKAYGQSLKTGCPSGVCD